jgi:radical S-adenosyl methionine domain-containing protein 2
MRCRFCFTTFNDIRKEYGRQVPLSRDPLLALAQQIGSRFQKISLAGGEPLLCPCITEIIGALKKQGTVTSLVTNGSLLIVRPKILGQLSGCLDWIGLSVDSAVPSTLMALGRTKNGQPFQMADYVMLAERIRKSGIRLKINTVVTALNYKEDMSIFIQAMAPERWKVFQVLPIQGQNDGKIDDLLIGPKEFTAFVVRHMPKFAGVMVAETNEVMLGSYAMIDPAGRFFDDTAGKHNYSEPIQQIGIDAAFSQVRFLRERFDKRGGRYQWI